MHANTDSEMTSLAPSSLPSPRRPAYYVTSPPHPDGERVSLDGSADGGFPINPNHHHYASSSFHHSLETSAVCSSAPLKHSSWRKIPDFRLRLGGPNAGDVDEEEIEDRKWGFRCHVILFLLGFALLFALFCLLLWKVGESYKPEISIKSVVFEYYNVQVGMDPTGVPTKMLSLNSTVRIKFRNTATFFGVHVTSTPLALHYSELTVASGEMKEFYEHRKSARVVSIPVAGTEVPLYGGGSGLCGSSKCARALVPLDLTFVVRSKAYVLGKLVRPKFSRHVRCSLYLRENRLGKPVLNLNKACHNHDRD